jgi:two-component system, cell cycle sensor histidine kinase and response regulator CckA
VYSAPGRGTTFKVFIPASSLPMLPQPSKEGSIELEGSGRILVVDDEAGVRKLLTAIIERHGYSVITASNGAEAIEIFEREADQIDLVILDLTMPVMSGQEAFRELHRMRPKTPVLLSSGFNEAEAIQQFAGKRLAGFVQKPFTSRQLAESIKQALTRARE